MTEIATKNGKREKKTENGLKTGFPIVCLFFNF